MNVTVSPLSLADHVQTLPLSCPVVAVNWPKNADEKAFIDCAYDVVICAWVLDDVVPGPTKVIEGIVGAVSVGAVDDELSLPQPATRLASRSGVSVRSAVFMICLSCLGGPPKPKASAV